MRYGVVLLVVLVLGSGLTGCSRIFGQRYDNFTSYYNTFYNARSEFDREEEQLLKSEARVDRDRYLALFFEPREGGEQREGFEKAIEKGADLLREHPESKWVDDALLLIGKARFYQGDWSGAEQKFLEVIEVGADKLVDEARFWLGRTLISAEQYEDAALALREGLDRPEVREQWAAQMRLALAETDVRAGNWNEAVTSLQEGIEGIRDRELAARAEFLLAQVYETIDDPGAAADAYERALQAKPRYELAYAAGLSEAIARSHNDEGEEALRLLRRMERDDKNFENRGEIEMTRARVLNAVGRSGSARDLLRDLLYDPDPTMQTGSIRGPIHYRLAEVYRDGLNDYIRAAAHYDTAATSIRQINLIDERTTPQAIIDASLLADAFGTYASVAGEIAEMDSLLYLGSLNDEDFEDAIAQIRLQREREARERERDLARRRSEQGFGGTPVGGFGDGGRPQDDAGGGAPGGGGTDTGFLDFRNPVRVQEALIAFQGRWGERPYAPNWRRAEALAAVSVTRTVGEDGEPIDSVQTVGGFVDAIVDVSDVPRDAESQRFMRLDRAAARYELGNTLFLSLGRPDSAIVLYRSVLKEDEESAVSQRAYFALAEAQRALGNETEAERLYNDVIARYPNTRFAEQARLQLGLPPLEQDVAVDSLGLAEAAYATAYATWKAGEYKQAMGQMLTLSRQYASTPVAAQARLAAGAVYTEWAAGDEDALLAPTPTLAPAIDDSLLFLPPPGTTIASVPLPTDSTSVIEPPPEARDEEAEDVAEEGGVLQEVWPEEVPVDEASDDLFGEELFGDVTESLDVDSTRGLFFPIDSTATDLADLNLPPDVGDELALLDSTLAAEEATPIAVDSTTASGEIAPVPELPQEVVEPEEDPWLDVLYASIESDFPGTPYAARARALRSALDGLRPDRVPATADSTSSDSEVADGAEGPVGGLNNPALRGEDPIQHRKNAYSWVVLASPDRTEAEGALASVYFQGYRAAINTVVDATQRDDNITYQVLIGLFSSQEEAQAARGALPERVPMVGGQADPETFTVYRLGPGRGEIEQASEIFRSGDQ